MASSSGRAYPTSNLKQVLRCPKIQTLIIAIPGVGTSDPSTWTDSNPSTSGRLWFEAIPSSEAPGLGVFSYAHGVTPRDLSWKNFLDQGLTFIEDLLRLIDELRVRNVKTILLLIELINKKLEHCPVLLISHSLGGLIAKEGLRKAYHDGYRAFLRALAGVVLLGTPHSSMNESNKWFNATLTVPSSSKKRVMSSEDVETLANSSLLFEQASVKVPILSVHETKMTKVKTSFLTSKRTLIMDEDFVKTGCSNEEVLAVDTDHNDLCTLDSGTQYFEKICNFISTSLGDARLHIRKGSPIYEAPSVSDDFSVVDSGALLQTAGKTTDSSSSPNASLSGNRTLYATAGSSDLGFDLVPLGAPTVFQRHTPSRFPCFFVPVPPNGEFFGRKEVLEAIDKAFLSQQESQFEGTDTKTFAICGPGGMGKTQVAAEFVHSRRNLFDAIFWIHAASPVQLRDEFGRIAIHLGLVGHDSADVRDQVVLRELVKGWLANPVKNEFPDQPGSNLASWLLVFDNVDDTEVLNDYWPLEGPGCVLFTSRDSLAKNSSYLANTGVDLQPFTKEEAGSFLRKLTNKPGDNGKVHEKLCGLPLAITQMASVIIRRDLSYAEFIACYEEEERHHELFKLRFENKNQPSQYKKTIWSVWALENLKHSRPLLEVLSMLDPDGVWEYILTSHSNKLHLIPSFPTKSSPYQKARTELLQSSLVSRDSSASRLVVHRLIQDAARSKMGNERFQQVFSSALLLVSSVWPYEEFGWRHAVKRWKVCEEIFPHVVQLRRFGLQLPREIRLVDTLVLLARLLTDAGWYYHETGYSDESTPFFDSAMDLCDSMQGAVNSGQEPGIDCNILAQMDQIKAEVHHNLGCIGTETNQPSHTLHHFKIFNEMMVKESGSTIKGKDSRLSISWNELGNAYLMNDQLFEGQECFHTSIKSARLREGFQPTDASLPRVNLGLAQWMSGRHDEALETLLAGLADREAAYGPDDKESFITGRFLHALGNVTASQARHEDSFTYHTRALRQYENTIGRNHHRTGDVHVKVAEHHIRLGSFDRAMAHIDEALRIFGGKSVYRPEKARALHKKSLILGRLGHEEDAQRLRRQCTALYRQLYPSRLRSAEEPGDDHFDTAVAFWSR